MGWPKKDEGFRLYLERKAKSYLLVEIPTYDSVGEMLIDNDPERPCLGSCNPDHSHLYKKCKRVSWDEMPEVWQKALAQWITGEPEDYRGLWRMGKEST